MAPFSEDSFLRAVLDQNRDRPACQLTLMHLGAELLELERMLQKETRLNGPSNGDRPTEIDRSEP